MDKRGRSGGQSEAQRLRGLKGFEYFSNGMHAKRHACVVVGTSTWVNGLVSARLSQESSKENINTKENTLMSMHAINQTASQSFPISSAESRRRRAPQMNAIGGQASNLVPKKGQVWKKLNPTRGQAVGMAGFEPRPLPKRV